MCLVVMRMSGTLEIFPDITCDDLREMRRLDVDVGDVISIEAVFVGDDGMTFILPTGESSTAPLHAVDVVQRCGMCELSHTRRGQRPISGGVRNRRPAARA